MTHWWDRDREVGGSEVWNNDSHRLMEPLKIKGYRKQSQLSESYRWYVLIHKWIGEVHIEKFIDESKVKLQPRAIKPSLHENSLSLKTLVFWVYSRKCRWITQHMHCNNKYLPYVYPCFPQINCSQRLWCYFVASITWFSLRLDLRRPQSGSKEYGKTFRGI